MHSPRNLAVDGLQPKLDRRRAHADALFEETLESAESLAQEVPEAQADFYREDGNWVAQLSTSQDELPFPDPAL